MRRAGLVALRQSLSVEQVTMAHFEEALDDTRASVTPDMEREYEQMAARLKQEALSAPADRLHRAGSAPSARSEGCGLTRLDSLSADQA